MKKDNLILLILLGVVVVLVVVCGIFAYQREEQTLNKSDAEKIAEEYASLNDQVNETNNLTYPSVDLGIDNPFVYASEETIIDLLENKTGVIYFGFSSCPWCRSMLPILNEAASEVGMGRIYYLNVQDIRDTLELDENNKVVTTKEGSNGYYQILSLLDEYLSEYTLEGKKNELVDTNEKRLFAPTVVGVRNGEIVGFHEGTVDTQENGFSTLTDEEKEELKKIYVEILNQTLEGTCNEAC